MDQIFERVDTKKQSSLNLSTKQNHKLNAQNSIKDIIMNKQLVIKKKEKNFQTQSNIETSKLEAPKYHLRCHTLVELNGFDKLELHS